MARWFKKNKQKVVKGTSSAVVLSILIHAGLFTLAGALVIFKVMNPETVAFKAPPPVKVPKMPLKKLTPKLKKPSKPKSTAKIVALVEKVDINQIQFPDLATSGVGAGISDGESAVSFGDMPSFDDGDGIFGGEVSIGNDLEVTYYDLKRTRAGRYKVIGNDEWRAAFRKFFKDDWDTTVLSRYYRAPQKRYASCVVMPATGSYMAPAAFGEGDAPGTYWLAHYQGAIVHPEDITFRFWVSAEDSLAIRIDEKVVVAASFVDHTASAMRSERSIESYGALWEADTMDSLKYVISNGRATVGNWITLKGGEPLPMEIVLTDNGGFGFTAIVAVEVKGVEYERSVWGGPLLPVFKTSDIPRDLLDIIYADLSEGEVCLTNGPVFRDY